MNPAILKSIAKGAEIAYANREVALDVLSKIKVWRKSKAKDADDVEPMSTEDRIERLESSAETRDLLHEEQSELLAGLAASVADLTASSQALLTRTKFLIALIVISMGLSVAALVVALME